MKNTSLALAGAALASLALAGCATVPEDQGHPLTGTTWKLVDVETEGTSTRLKGPQQDRHTLVFNEDGTMQLKLDCNNGNGTWNASDPVDYNGTLTIGPIAATRALCPEPSFGEDLALDLPTATGYTLSPDGDGLVIRARRVIFAFAAD